MGFSIHSFHALWHKGILQTLTIGVEIGDYLPSYVDDPISREVALVQSEPVEEVWVSADGIEFQVVTPATVYPPREDSGLLDSCLNQIDFKNGQKILEIGCGTGVVSIAAAKRGAQVFCCDINPFAVAATRKNAELNGVDLFATEGGVESPDLFDLPAHILEHAPFDLIAWNLPYLEPPRENEPHLGPLEDAALLDTSEGNGWGYALMKALNSGEILSPTGAAYVVHSSTPRGKTLQSHWRSHGWATRIADEVTFSDGERLTCFCAWRPFMNSPIERHEALDSTNAFLLSSNHPAGTMITAKIQTEGRGQREREWAQVDGDFAGSWVLPEPAMNWAAGDIQIAAGMAIIDSIVCQSGLPLPTAHWTHCSGANRLQLEFRWPNDVWISNGKLAGCLIEARQKGEARRCILGIGVNLCEKGEQPFEYSCLPAQNSETELSDFQTILHASIASAFEETNFTPPPQMNRQVSWSLLARHISKGVALELEDSQLRIVNLDAQSQLVCDLSGTNQIITDSYEKRWV